MGAALGAVIILATALSAGFPAIAADRPLRRSAATMGLLLFLTLGGLTSIALAVYLSCTVGFGGGGC